MKHLRKDLRIFRENTFIQLIIISILVSLHKFIEDNFPINIVRCRVFCPHNFKNTTL